MMGGPARGYTRSAPPFELGNLAGLRHGADSDRKLAPLVAQLLEHLAEVAPWTTGAPFAAVVSAWAWTEAKVILYRRYFDQEGLGLDAEKPPTGLTEWDRAERRAASLRAELGLSPASLTRLLGGLSSIDAPAAQSGLEALRAAGRDLRAAADQRALSAAPDEADG